MMELSKDVFWNLLAKKLAGEATPAELEELIELSRQHPELMYAAQHIEDLWQLQPDFDNIAVEEAFRKHCSTHRITTEAVDEENPASDPDLNVEYPPIRRWRSISITVVFLLGAVSFYLMKYGPAANTSLAVQPVQEVISRPGTKTKLLLPDGTTVWLNAGSKMTYEPDFGVSSRQVSISGEAFFEVKKSKIPFIVKTGVVNIKVLGTAFNVRSYPGDKTTETSLIHGKVEIRVDRRPDEVYILKPNEKLVVKNETAPVEKQVRNSQPLIVLSSLTLTKDSLVTETSWVENKLVFEDESFDEIAQKMERWYNVKIIFTDEKVKTKRFTGVLEQETIIQALEALQYTGRFHFSTNENIITIKK